MLYVVYKLCSSYPIDYIYYKQQTIYYEKEMYQHTKDNNRKIEKM